MIQARMFFLYEDEKDDLQEIIASLNNSLNEERSLNSLLKKRIEKLR